MTNILIVFSFQIDLTDMRHLPHNGYKWILHLVDHWSKFHFAYPLMSKSAKYVASALEKWVFPVMTERLSRGQNVLEDTLVVKSKLK